MLEALEDRSRNVGSMLRRNAHLPQRSSIERVKVSVAVIGLDRRRSSTETLERVALGADRLTEALDRLAKSENITETVVLSTCMRTEVYFDAVRFHPAVLDICQVLASMADVDLEVIETQAFEAHDESAYEHLFRVAAGLESAVIGESEVLGQVSRAWEAARDHGSCKSVLGGLFRHALVVGKRVRHETAIARGITSIGQAAVVMAEAALGSLESRNVLVVGAGDMGEGMAVAVCRSPGISDVIVANRTEERAVALADRVGGRSISLDEVPTALESVDVVLTSTGAPTPLLGRKAVEAAMEARDQRPLVLVDVAVPRDVEADVAEIDGVTVLDLTDLQLFTEVGRAERMTEVAIVETILQQEVAAYCQDVNGRLVAPVVAALRERAEAIRQQEIERYKGRLGDLTEKQMEAVNAVTRCVIAKLLHEPTVELKLAAGTAEGDRMAQAVRRLFGV